MGLAETEKSLKLQALDLSILTNFGGLILNCDQTSGDGDIYEIKVSTIDSFRFGRVDSVKTDVEGMERSVLDGAIRIISRESSIIFCECNSLASGNEILQYFNNSPYEAFGFLSNAYGSDNSKSNSKNIFGNAKELRILLLPGNDAKFLNELGQFDLVPIRDLEDLVLLLLEKPQFLPNVLATELYAPLYGRRTTRSSLAKDLRDVATVQARIEDTVGGWM